MFNLDTLLQKVWHMRKVLCTCGLALLLLAGVCMQAAAQQYKWIALGDARLNAKGTTAFIPVDTGKGTFCSIRFKTQGGTVGLDQVIVHFGNSQALHVSTNFSFSDESYSPSVALPGNPRTIKGIELIYKLNGQQTIVPTVDLWGGSLAGVLVCPR